MPSSPMVGGLECVVVRLFPKPGEQRLDQFGIGHAKAHGSSQLTSPRIPAGRKLEVASAQFRAQDIRLFLPWCLPGPTGSEQRCRPAAGTGTSRSDSSMTLADTGLESASAKAQRWSVGSSNTSYSLEASSPAPPVNGHAPGALQPRPLALLPGFAIQVIKDQATPIPIPVGGYGTTKRRAKSAFTALGQIGDVTWAHGVTDASAGLARNQRHTPKRRHAGEKYKQKCHNRQCLEQHHAQSSPAGSNSIRKIRRVDDLQSDQQQGNGKKVYDTPMDFLMEQEVHRNQIHQNKKQHVEIPYCSGFQPLHAYRQDEKRRCRIDGKSSPAPWSRRPPRVPA